MLVSQVLMHFLLFQNAYTHARTHARTHTGEACKIHYIMALTSCWCMSVLKIDDVHGPENILEIH